MRGFCARRFTVRFLTQADTNAAEKLPGVKIIRRDDLIAVVHADPEAAAFALTKIQADWQLPQAAVTPDTMRKDASP